MPQARNYNDVHYDRVMTDFAVAYWNAPEALVSSRVFPAVPVRKATDKYREFPKGYWTRSDIDASITERSEPNEVDYKSVLKSYSVESKALRHFISDKARANVDREQNLDFESTELVTHTLSLYKEKMFVDNFLKPGVWTKDHEGVASGASGDQIVKWNATGGNPVKDIQTAARAMQVRTGGYRPNRILVSRDVWDALKLHSDIQSYIKGGATTERPSIVQLRLLAQLFEVDRIDIMEVVHNTAVDGVEDATTKEPPTDMSFMKENFLFLYYQSGSQRTAQSSKPTAGVTFTWNEYDVPANTDGMGTGPQIVRYRAPVPQRGEFIEGRYSQSFKIISKDCGTFFNSVI